MKRDVSKYFGVFVIGVIFSSAIGIAIYRHMVIGLEEEKYFDLAIQIKWHLATLRAIQNQEYAKARTYSEEQLMLLTPLFENYADSYSGKYKMQFGEITRLLRDYSETNE